MSVAALPHAKLMRAIELLGTRVAPLVRTALASETAGADFADELTGEPGDRIKGLNSEPTII
jgi:hypothetical protein